MMRTKMQLNFNKDVVMPALLLMVVYVSLAQGTMNWPTDNPLVKEKQALYLDALKNENYAEALAPFQWLLDSVPKLNKALYIHGDRLYKELERQEQDEAAKRLYQEKRLSLFDRRLLYFADEINVLNRKAFASYTYYKNRPEKYKELFELYQKVLALDSSDILKVNVAVYPYVVGLHKSRGGEMDDTTLLAHYDKITGIIQHRALDEALQRSADSMLAEGGELSCEFIQSRLGDLFIKDPGDIAKAKKIVQLSIAFKCKDAPVFLQAAEVVYDAREDGNLAYMIASIHYKNDSLKQAEHYYREALKSVESDERKSNIYFALASLYRHHNLKSSARTAALNSIVYDPFSKKSYKLIGDLYLSSVEECKKYKSRTQDRTIYIAAYDMYKKAEDKTMMNTTKEQFPSMENIFEDNLSLGQTMQVGCWVNEEVTLQNR